MLIQKFYLFQNYKFNIKSIFQIMKLIQLQKFYKIYYLNLYIFLEIMNLRIL